MVGRRVPLGKEVFDFFRATPKEVKDFHNNSDADSGTRALHHTLGRGAFQAASGIDLANLETRVDSLEVAKVETRVEGTTLLSTPLSAVGAWTNDAAFIGTTFVAPKSGNVMAVLTAYLKVAAAGQGIAIDTEVREGSTIGAGTVVAPADLLVAAANYSVDYARLNAFKFVRNLTPGATYNIKGKYRPTAGSGHTIANITTRVMGL